MIARKVSLGAGGVVLLALGCHSTTPQTSGPVAVALRSGDVGRTPRGFTTALTGGGGPVSWIVRNDTTASGGRAIVQESVDDTSYRFPLCVYDGFVGADVSAEVKFKTISGTVDQAAGLVLRYTPENYYVARPNTLEDNINLFKTVNGKRIKLAEVATKTPAGEWHTLGFSVKGSHLTVTLDGEVVIEQDDTTITGPGKVGLWTKADSVTAFAELKIEVPQ